MPNAHEIETPSERCRICRCSFKVKFGAASQPGKSGYISSENLFNPSKRKDALGEILADTCRAVGLKVLEDNEVFSDLCVVLVLSKYYELILSSIGSGAAAFKTPSKQRIIKCIQAAGRNATGAAVLVASLFMSTLLKLLASLYLQAQQIIFCSRPILRASRM